MSKKKPSVHRAKWQFIPNDKEDGPAFYFKDVLSLTVVCSVAGPKKYKLYLDSFGNTIGKEVEFKGSLKHAKKRGDKMLRKYLGQCIHMLRGKRGR